MGKELGMEIHRKTGMTKDLKVLDITNNYGNHLKQQ